MRNINYDWLDDAWKGAFSMKHNLNLSGGTQKQLILLVFHIILKVVIWEPWTMNVGIIVLVWMLNWHLILK